jgi:hypothetical protein
MANPPKIRKDLTSMLKPSILDKLGKILGHRYRTVTIDFDDAPDNTVINTYYVDKGVTFGRVTTSPPSSGGPVYARHDDLAETPPNVVTLYSSSQSAWFTCFDAYQGGVEVKFPPAVCSVSIDAQATLSWESIGNDDNRPFMEVYNTNGAKMAEVLYPYRYDEVGFGTWQRLSYSSSRSNIGSIRFSSQRVGSNYVYGWFDTLIYRVDILSLIPR